MDKIKIITTAIYLLFIPLITGNSQVSDIVNMASGKDVLEYKETAMSIKQMTSDIKKYSEAKAAWLKNTQAFKQLPQIMAVKELLEEGICLLDRINLQRDKLSCLGYRNCFMDFEIKASMIRVQNAQSFFNWANKVYNFISSNVNSSDKKLEQLDESVKKQQEALAAMARLDEGQTEILRQIHALEVKQSETLAHMKETMSFLNGNITSEIAENYRTTSRDFDKWINTVCR